MLAIPGHKVRSTDLLAGSASFVPWLSRCEGAGVPKCRPWLLLHSPSTASASSGDVPFAVRVIEYTQPAAIADSGVLVALHPGAAARLPFVETDLPFVETDRWKQKVLEPTRVAKGSENKFTMKISDNSSGSAT